MKTRLHKFLSIFLVSVMLLTAAPLSGFVGLDINLDWLDFTTKASAVTYSGTCGDNLTWTFNESTGELVISGTGAMEDYEGFSDAPWYSYRSSITTVTIPDSVTTIGDYAFYCCVDLTDVTIPDSVTKIGGFAFRGCSKLTIVTIGDSVTVIGMSAFSYCQNLTSVTIPDSVTTIGDFAFSGCDNLTSVTIGDSVNTIGDSAFYECVSLTSVTIGDSVNTIGDSAFYGCNSLETVYYNGTQVQWSEISTKSGNNPLANATIHFKEVEVSGTCGDNLTWYLFGVGELIITGTGAMSNYSSASSVPWYNYRSSITTVTISNGVTSIGEKTFSDCINLASVIIPDSVTAIGYKAFVSCASLTDVYYNGKLTKLVAISIESYNDPLTSATIHCEELVANGKCGDNLIWYFCDEGELIITGTGAISNFSSVSSVPWYNYRSSIKSVTVPDSVTTIGNYAFYNCNGLTSVIIPDSVTTIGDQAFNRCYRLNSVTIPDSVTAIGKDTFGNCSKLVVDLYKDSYAETYAINNNLVYCYIYNVNEEKIISVKDSSQFSFEINKETYTLTVNCVGNMLSFAENEYTPWIQYMPYIKHIVIDDGCTSIGNYAFKNMRSVKSVIIPDSVTAIGKYAFYNCTGLTDVTMGNGVTTIGEYAFSRCISLTSAIIGNGITTIGVSAFENCTSLKSVEILQGVTKISSCAFCNCTSLKSVTIGNDVTSIGASAFEDCYSLTSVTIGNSVTSIGGCAFSYCDELKEFTMPISAAIYYDAFYGCNNIEKITLTKGNGKANNYTSSTYSYTPWYKSREKCDEIIIEYGVTGIGSYTFYGCSNLGSITLPDSVKSIGDYAFSNCKSLEKLVVNNKNCTFEANSISSSTTIVGYAGSTAEAYANDNGLKIELISDDDHEHTYLNGCDNECNICGYIRTDLTHTYSYVCDVDCDLCGFFRTDVVHTYSSDCDSDCDVCGYTRTEITHTYSSDCDADCDICGNIRTELNHTDENTDGICDVCEKRLSDIAIGVTENIKVTAGKTVQLKFSPAQSGVYTFYSSSSSDTYGYIYDANKNQLASNDDDGDGNNFSITYTFKAGTIYFLGVRYYNSSTSGEIPVTIRLDEIICDHNVTHTEHKDSTCTENGYDKVICDDCGNTVSTTKLPLLEHSYKTIVSNPTCQSAGSIVHYCTMCKYAYLEKITDPVDHDMRWVVVTKPTSSADGVKNYSCSYCGLVEDTKVVPAFLISDKSVANIDFDSNTISGFDAGATSIDDYVLVETDGYSFTCDSAVIGTGTVIELTDGDTVITEFTAVVFGDVNGDGWYDGTDSIIVSCLANGLLSKDDVSLAFYQAADCNHDGVIDSFDVAILEQAGLLLSNVDQSKSNEELATDEAFIEYLDLIDQTPEDETVEDEAPETPEVEPEVSETEEFDLIEFIITIIKKFFELLLSTLPIK